MLINNIPDIRQFSMKFRKNGSVSDLFCPLADARGGTGCVSQQQYTRVCEILDSLKAKLNMTQHAHSLLFKLVCHNELLAAELVSCACDCLKTDTQRSSPIKYKLS